MRLAGVMWRRNGGLEAVTRVVVALTQRVRPLALPAQGRLLRTAALTGPRLGVDTPPPMDGPHSVPGASKTSFTA